MKFLVFQSTPVKNRVEFFHRHNLSWFSKLQILWPKYSHKRPKAIRLVKHTSSYSKIPDHRPPIAHWDKVIFQQHRDLDVLVINNRFLSGSFSRVSWSAWCSFLPRNTKSRSGRASGVMYRNSASTNVDWVNVSLSLPCVAIPSRLIRP